MFFGEVRSVIFRPYWIPSLRIVKEEIVPRARTHPGWLAAHGMEIVLRGDEDAGPLPPTETNLLLAAHGNLTIRQRPGPHNDLGSVKFVMPNPECIGLHGTPHPELFERPRRDRSHGCIRVEDPASLAEWALAEQSGWDRRHIVRAMERKGPTEVKLAEPLPVVVLYATASADPDGRVAFRDDLYGLDALLEGELRQAPSPR
jgi:murein L,D-transpeptidase YcbB/YkuD